MGSGAGHWAHTLMLMIMMIKYSELDGSKHVRNLIRS
jgi:hypothetical protein